jgi:hypothetical protein
MNASLSIVSSSFGTSIQSLDAVYSELLKASLNKMHMCKIKLLENYTPYQVPASSGVACSK